MVAFLYDPIFLEHDTGAHHPETPRRLESLLNAVAPLSERLLLLSPPEATREQLLRVHTPEHIDDVARYAAAGLVFDADTPTSTHSYEAALKAAGAGVAAVDAVRSGKAASAFCAVRPPGHHATRERAMGFCLFNNIAVAARYARSVGYRKIFIVDFDVHHGNGTQGIFYDDPTVFYFSSHQYPAYPGSGDTPETGSGAGEGFTLNFPLFPETGDEAILPVYEEALPEAVAAFEPDLILVSAGYDLHRADPLAALYVSTEGVRRIVRCIMECSEVPKIFFLEGGYDLAALGECVKGTLGEMMANEK